MNSHKEIQLFLKGYDLSNFNSRQQRELYRALIHFNLAVDDCYLDPTIPAYKLRKQVGKLRLQSIK